MTKAYRGHTCIIPNCKSGYASTKARGEKHHFFSVPAGQENVDKWQKAVLREDFVVKTGQVVCEKHFPPEDILWKRVVLGPDGKVMAEEPYKVPRLRKGALPSIYPDCPKYLTKVVKTRKPPRKREINKENIKRKNTTKLDQLSVRNVDIERQNVTKLDHHSVQNAPAPDILVVSNALAKSDANTSTAPESSDSTNFTEVERVSLFQTIFSSKNSVKLPPAWSRYDISEGDFQAIQFFQLTGCVTSNNAVITMNSKKVVLFRDMSVHIFVMESLVKNHEVGFSQKYASSTQEIGNIINGLHKFKICGGCAAPDFMENVDTSCTIRDAFGFLRHKDCYLITMDLNQQTCGACRNVYIIRISQPSKN